MHKMNSEIFIKKKSPQASLPLKGYSALVCFYNFEELYRSNRMLSSVHLSVRRMITKTAFTLQK